MSATIKFMFCEFMFFFKIIFLVDTLDIHSEDINESTIQYMSACLVMSDFHDFN